MLQSRHPRVGRAAVHPAEAHRRRARCPARIYPLSVTGDRAPRTLLQAAEVAALAAPSRARWWASAVWRVPPAVYATGASISMTSTLHLDAQDGAHRAPLSPPTAHQSLGSHPPRSASAGPPTRTPPLPVAVAGAAEGTTALSGSARAPPSTLAAAARVVLRCCVWPATALRRGLGAARSPPPAAQAARPAQEADGTAVVSENCRR